MTVTKMPVTSKPVTSKPVTQRRRYAVAGTGHRAWMYIDAILGKHADVAELVAWCEPNPTRIDYYDALEGARGGAAALPRYAPDALEQMIDEQRVDVVVVTAPDHTHADLVSRALAAGADAVVEKPLTIDAAGCRTITGAVAATARDVVMTFNYRYAPRNSSLKEVIASGAIGTVTSVHFEWALDTVHGADYFRRWHREKDRSGGLLVHKSSHHFDLVTWWLDLTQDPRLKALYLDAEHHDGYRRDQDVFGPGITIEDTMAVLVDYRGGATLTYSLNAYAPWEGYKVTVNGTAGRAELEVVERGSVEFDEQGRAVLDPSVSPGAFAGDTLRPIRDRLLVHKHWERAAEHAIPQGIGGHGGGDAILLTDVFRGPGADPLGRRAGYLDGVRAVAVGIAANESMRTRRAVAIADLELGTAL